MANKKKVNNMEEPVLKKKKVIFTKPVLIKIIFISLIIVGIIVAYRFQSAYSIVYTEEIRSVEIEESGYDNNVSGSYHIDKSASWIGLNRARINFELNSLVLTSDGYKDIILVMDVSGSMQGAKIQRAIEDAKELTEVLLSDSNNKMALITFASTSSIMTQFTNNKETMLGYINSLNASGSTNYNSGLLNVDEIMNNYTKESNRELVLLFLTDGYPNVEVPNQVATAGILKAKYPYMTINGIQYEMGKDIIKEIEEITDNAWVADQYTLNNVLFEASVSPVSYDNFKIVDYVSSDYYVESVDDIKVSSGTVILEDENGLQKITWDLGNTYQTGSNENMTIDATLKIVNQGNLGFYPTNASEKIISKLPEEEEKELISDKTPVLKNIYNVVYEGNPPSGCSINYHETESHAIYENVAKKDEELECDGYIFKGFSIVENDVNFINDDLYIMPGHDILFRGIWSKPVISKSMDGVVRTSYSATFDTGRNVNSKMKTLAKGSSVSYDTQDTLIKNIERGSELPSGFEATLGNTISSSASELPIYIWFDDTTGTIYYYTETENIYLNEDSSYLFNNCRKLTTLDLSSFDTSNVTNMEAMFKQCYGFIRLDLGDNFNTANVTNMSSMFYYCSGLIELDLSNFDTSNVRNMSSMFYYCRNLEIIDLGNNFDTTNVKFMNSMFDYCSKLISLNLGDKFDTQNVTHMNMMFRECNNLENLLLGDKFDTRNVINMISMFDNCSKLISLNLGDKFDTSKVTTMQYMFSGCSGLTSLDLGDKFDTSKVTDMSSMFNNCSKLTSLNLGDKFDTSNVTNMSSMFNNCSKLTSLDLKDKFDTSKVTIMQNMFAGCSSLTSLDLGNSFDTSKVTTMKWMFRYCSSLTSLDLGDNFNTSKVTDMSVMFAGCSSLTSLDLGNYFDTSNVKSMPNMFSNCSELVSLNLGDNFNTANVTDMMEMFNNCSKLTVLDLGIHQV